MEWIIALVITGLIYRFFFKSRAIQPALINPTITPEIPVEVADTTPSDLQPTPVIASQFGIEIKKWTFQLCV